MNVCMVNPGLSASRNVHIRSDIISVCFSVRTFAMKAAEAEDIGYGLKYPRARRPAIIQYVYKCRWATATLTTTTTRQRVSPVVLIYRRDAADLARG